MRRPIDAATFDASTATTLASIFDLGAPGALEGPVARGEQGQVWRLTTDRGEWAVKESFAVLDSAHVEEDAAYQAAAGHAGVRLPRVVRTLDGVAMADLDGMFVRVFEWVDLLAPTTAMDPAQVGRVVAAIHQVVFTGSKPTDWWYSAGVGADRWRTVAVDLAESAAPFADAFAALRDDFIAVEAVLSEPRELHTCHRDLFADNVLPTADGGICVIDWENSGLADRSQELAVVLFEFSLDDAARAGQLYRSYCDAGGPGRITGRGDFSMLVAQMGNICRTICESWLDPEEPNAERHRQAGRFAEFVDRPVNLSTIDRLLDAITPS